MRELRARVWWAGTTIDDAWETVAYSVAWLEDAAEAYADRSGFTHDDFPIRVFAQLTEGPDRKVRVFDVEREYSPEHIAFEARRCPDCRRRLAGIREFRCHPCTYANGMRMRQKALEGGL